MQQADDAVDDELDGDRVGPPGGVNRDGIEFIKQRDELKDRPGEGGIGDAGAEDDRGPHDEHGQAAGADQLLCDGLGMRVLVVVLAPRAPSVFLGQALVSDDAADKRGAQAHEERIARALAGEFDEVLGAGDIGPPASGGADKRSFRRAVDDDVGLAANAVIIGVAQAEALGAHVAGDGGEGGVRVRLAGRGAFEALGEAQFGMAIGSGAHEGPHLPHGLCEQRPHQFAADEAGGSSNEDVRILL